VSSPDDISAQLASRLLEVRKDRILTQEEVARELGISTRSYQGYEAGDGRLPRQRTRRRIEQWLMDEAWAA
jgi:transcriptional regulator with XRE-family HTH domain